MKSRWNIFLQDMTQKIEPALPSGCSDNRLLLHAFLVKQMKSVYFFRSFLLDHTSLASVIFPFSQQPQLMYQWIQRVYFSKHVFCSVNQAKVCRVPFIHHLYHQLFLDRAPSHQFLEFFQRDRGRQIEVLFLSADFLPRRVHLFPSRLLSKNKAAMCRPLREVGGGVDDLHCCATHSRGF